jgi:cation transport regulator
MELARERSALSASTEQRRKRMPYATTSELPKSVRDALPAHAQEIFRAAVNNAWDQYANANERRGDESREEAAHKVAWAAVKRQYHKDAHSERWVENAHAQEG